MQSQKLRVIALFGVSLLITAVGIVIVIPSANQYEISLYAAYPDFFWIFLIGAMIVGSAVILGSAQIPEDRSWIFGLFLLFMSNILLLTLPYIRGYMLYGRSDSMSHIGFIKDILSLGGISNNIYPPLHLLVLSISEATGLGIMTASFIIPIIFTALFFVGMYYTLVYLLDSRKAVLYGIPFVMLPILGRAHIELRPYEASILFIPIVFYLFFKSQRNPLPHSRMIFVIALITILLYHPLTALFLIGIFAIYFAGRHTPRIKDQYATPTSFISLTAAIFLAWYTSFIGILQRFNFIYDTLFGQNRGEPPVQRYSETAEEASPALVDVLQTLTFQYGIEFVLFGFGFLFLGLASLLFFRKVYAIDSYTVMLGGMLVIFSVGGLLFFVLDLIVPHTRPFQIAKIGAAILAGQAFFFIGLQMDWVRDRPKFQIGIHVFLFIVIILLVSLSVFSLYASPLKTSTNEQVTEMELEGSEWVTKYGAPGNNIAGFQINYQRFHHALYGTTASRDLQYADLPDHFGYRDNDYLGESYTDDTYVTVTESGRLVYVEVFPDYQENWRYTPAEFERLEQDLSVQRIYDNGDYNQYQANSMVNT